MPTSSFYKINDFVEGVAHKEHDLENDQLAVALSDTAPDAETDDPSADGNGILANVTEIAYDNLDGATPRNITTSSSGQTGGTYKLVLEDLTLLASGGDLPSFRYVYIYNDDHGSDALICYADYGSSVTLTDGEDIVIDFDDAEGLLQIT